MEKRNNEKEYALERESSDEDDVQNKEDEWEYVEENDESVHSGDEFHLEDDHNLLSENDDAKSILDAMNLNENTFIKDEEELILKDSESEKHNSI